MTRWCSPLLAAFGLVVAFGATPGCNCNHNPVTHLGGTHDMAHPASGSDGGVPLPDGGVNACGDNVPSCTTPCLGPTCMPPSMFPLPSDMPPDPNVGSDGVGRQPGTGWIVLNTQNASFNYIWIADDQDYFVGMVSKVDTRSKAGMPGGAVNNNYREVARYLTVTCNSNESASWLSHDTFKIGQNAAGGPTHHGPDCDGTKGCCARAVAGARVAVQLYHNRPSRTAVDFNGDAWIANRAHDGYGAMDPYDGQIEHQSSVTKIANDPSECIDRNGDGKIQTSSDANNDGIINTDCNGNGIPDSIADVKATPCTGGAMQEFWGLDDECILFTTNTGAPGGVGRPLALGPGATEFSSSDAWAGRFADGIFYRINGSTGLAGPPVQVNPTSDGIQSRPYGAAIDEQGILWAPNLDNAVLFYFDTTSTANQGNARPPAAVSGTGAMPWKGTFYGIALDGLTVTPPGGMPMLSQQVWLANWSNSAQGPGVWRYTPNRTTGFAGLNQGPWTLFSFGAGAGGSPAGNGRGVGVDNRQPQSYAWLGIDGSAGVGRVPIDSSPNTDATKTLEVTIPATANTTYLQTGRKGTLGTGVAADLDVWAINQTDSSATHFKIDSMGTQTGIDQVELDDNKYPATPPVQHQPPMPYTYSDFTGFGLRNFTNPHGFYSYIYSGCGPAKTKWLKIVWDAAVPMGTALQVKARSADDRTLLLSAPYTAPYTMSPADLATAPGPVMPNPSGYLEVEFDFSTTSKSLTPALKSFTVLYECVGGIG
jgi:hypothetical protein